VTIKARVIEKIFSFREASASFQAERFFFVRIRVIGLLVTSLKRPREFLFVLFLYLLCPRPPRDFLFYFEFSFFFGKRGEARGNSPADRGRRRRIASRTISGFTFGSPPFFLI
jgi:hypothetical protein